MSIEDDDITRCEHKICSHLALKKESYFQSLVSTHCFNENFIGHVVVTSENESSNQSIVVLSSDICDEDRKKHGDIRSISQMNIIDLY
jgi:hypothetical protein